MKVRNQVLSKNKIISILISKYILLFGWILSGCGSKDKFIGLGYGKSQLWR